MDSKYTFEQFYENLESGYQIFFTYVRNRYLIFKTAENMLLFHKLHNF